MSGRRGGNIWKERRPRAPEGRRQATLQEISESVRSGKGYGLFPVGRKED